MKLEGQTALITGGCSGLGLATAKLFVSKGMKVVIADQNSKQGKSIVDQLGEENCYYLELDVTRDDEVRDAVEAAVQHFGSIRVFVNCAGIIHAEMTVTSSKIHSSTAFRKILNVNLLGTFYTSKYAAWHLKSLEAVDGQRGVIINVASVAAEDGQRGQIAYSASKAAIVGMTLPMARDLGKFGIRVVALAPGPFITPMGDEVGEKTMEGIARTISLGRLGKPTEFANMVAAVVNNSYLSGVTIRLDGGLRMPHI